MRASVRSAWLLLLSRSLDGRVLAHVPARGTGQVARRAGCRHGSSQLHRVTKNVIGTTVSERVDSDPRPDHSGRRPASISSALHGRYRRTRGRASTPADRPCSTWVASDLAGIYPVGILFGLGFDTATEVSLLVLAGSAVVERVRAPCCASDPVRRRDVPARHAGRLVHELRLRLGSSRSRSQVLLRHHDHRAVGARSRRYRHRRRSGSAASSPTGSASAARSQSWLQELQHGRRGS